MDFDGIVAQRHESSNFFNNLLARPMSFVLDVAAGVLIAAGIVGIVALGCSFLAGAPEGMAGQRWVSAGFWVTTLGVLLGIAVVVCRLFRGP